MAWPIGVGRGPAATSTLAAPAPWQARRDLSVSFVVIHPTESYAAPEPPMRSPLTKSLRRFVQTGRRAKPAAANRRNLKVERLEAREVPAAFRALSNLMPASSGGAESMLLLTDGT